jgi:hypothetical protein
MRESLDGASNVMSRRDSHSMKDLEPIISTEFGIQIDESEEH